MTTQPADVEHKLRLLFETAIDYAMILLTPAGTIEAWNAGAQRLFGYDEQEMVGRGFSLLFLESDIQAAVPQRELEGAERTGRAEDRRWHERKDGSRFFADGITTSLRTDAGALIGFAKIARDGTHKKRADERLALQSGVTNILADAEELDVALPQILEQLALVLDADVANFWLLDEPAKVVRRHSSWQIPGLRSALTEAGLFGRGEGLPGRTWEEARAIWIEDILSESPTVFPRIVIAREEGFRTAIAFPVVLRERPFGVIEIFRRRTLREDEELIELLSLVGFQIGHFIDRRNANRLLRENEEKYRAIAEAASDAIFTIDTRSTIHYVNAACRRVFGYEPEELIGKSLDILIPERLRSAHRMGLDRYAHTGKRHIPWSGVELPGMHKSGQEIALELSFGEFVEGERHFFTGFARDVSDRHKADAERAELLAREQEARRHAEEISQQNAELYQAAQHANRAKDDFLATISHELRTPMASILGWVKLLKVDHEPATAREAVASLEISAMAQAQLIEDILDTARIREGKLSFSSRQVNLAEMIEQALDIIKVRVQEKKLELDVLLDRDVPPVEGDPNRLQQVMWNLLSNAVKFTPAGEKIEVRLRREDGRAIISVCDTGPGIPAEFIPHLFERFSQAEGTGRSSHGGLGLGLSIAHHLVLLHGGSIRAESKGEGTGATFIIELPLS